MSKILNIQKKLMLENNDQALNYHLFVFLMQKY